MSMVHQSHLRRHACAFKFNPATSTVSLRRRASYCSFSSCLGINSFFLVWILHRPKRCHITESALYFLAVTIWLAPRFAPDFVDFKTGLALTWPAKHRSRLCHRAENGLACCSSSSSSEVRTERADIVQGAATPVLYSLKGVGSISRRESKIHGMKANGTSRQRSSFREFPISLYVRLEGYCYSLDPLTDWVVGEGEGGGWGTIVRTHTPTDRHPLTCLFWGRGVV